MLGPQGRDTFVNKKTGGLGYGSWFGGDLIALIAGGVFFERCLQKWRFGRWAMK